MKLFIYDMYYQGAIGVWASSKEQAREKIINNPIYSHPFINKKKELPLKDIRYIPFGKSFITEGDI